MLRSAMIVVKINFPTKKLTFHIDKAIIQVWCSGCFCFQEFYLCQQTHPNKVGVRYLSPALHQHLVIKPSCTRFHAWHKCIKLQH